MSQASVQHHKIFRKGCGFKPIPKTSTQFLQKKGTSHVAKKDQKPKSSLTHSDVAALELTGLPYGEPEVISVRGVIKSKSLNAQKGGQYYELMDNSLWSKVDPDELDQRLFAAVRLVVEYDSPAGKHVHDKIHRRAALIGLIERIAESRHNQRALENLEILRRAGDKNAPNAE